MNTIDQFNEHIMGTYGRYPIVLESGKDRCAVDESGKRYIDFGSGIGTNSLGYCNEKWVEAVCEQVKKLQHTSNYYYTKVQADFSKKLSETTGMKKMFFGNSGAEANECAIKIARKYSFDKYGKGRHTIITLVNSFHGRTLTTLSATGQDVFHNYFFPFTEGFHYVTANRIDELRDAIDDSVCAIMFEYIQGEGGVVPLSKAFVDAIFQIAEEKDLLTIVDEVQTGVGRTGKFLAGDCFDKKADIVTLAKGIAGGLPMGVCLTGEKCAEVLTAGTHGSTFGGNPICCAGGLAVLEKAASPEFLEEVQKKADHLRDRLLKIDEVKSVSGIGLMVGIELKTKNAAEVVKKALDKGLLLLTAKTKVRLLPPLTITIDEIDEGVKILSELLSEPS
ncbi:MAG: aspartate aminotransferase family protein [Bacteroides sp.]|nr:aspartate aminotransferase family protein [Eubacterium sp.]MCM1419346.1 aspartate aminotransferase family protein [Roseburia sp.]MCM1463184.1 aspartate aminotransferase family protein [Bacteroides sp.]